MLVWLWRVATRVVTWPVMALIRHRHRQRARAYDLIADDVEAFSPHPESSRAIREKAAEHWRLGGVAEPPKCWHRVTASTPGAVAVGGDNNGTITTSVTTSGRHHLKPEIEER